MHPPTTLIVLGILAFVITASTIGLAASGAFDPEYLPPPKLGDAAESRKAAILAAQQRRAKGATLLSGTPQTGAPVVQTGTPALIGAQHVVQGVAPEAQNGNA